MVARMINNKSISKNKVILTVPVGHKSNHKNIKER